MAYPAQTWVVHGTARMQLFDAQHYSSLMLPASTQVYVSSIEPTAAAVLLAKRIVQQAQQRGAARDRTEADSVRTSVGAARPKYYPFAAPLRRQLAIRGGLQLYRCAGSTQP